MALTVPAGPASMTILVPLDGSPLGEIALPYAAVLARAAGGRLVLVRAATDAVARRLASGEIAAAAERLWKGGLEVEAHVRHGRAQRIILDAARRWDADLVAMSTHGGSGAGRWLYGSVADHVLRHSPVPVLLVPAACELLWPVRPELRTRRPPRILVTLDGSEMAESVLGVACAVAAALEAELHLVRVVPRPALLPAPPRDDLPYFGYAMAAAPLPALQPTGYPSDGAAADPRRHPDVAETEDLEISITYLERVARALVGGDAADAAAARRGGRPQCPRAPGAVHTHALAGDAAREIARLARRYEVDAVAMATHGRSGLVRLALGSVATAVLQRAVAPLILVGPGARETSRAVARVLAPV